MDNRIIWRLIHDLEKGKITAEKFRAAVTNAEIENLKKNIDSLYWGFTQSLNSSPYNSIWNHTEKFSTRRICGWKRLKMRLKKFWKKSKIYFKAHKRNEQTKTK